MSNIIKLLDKYEKDGANRRVKGEITSDEYYNKERRKAQLKNRHLILDSVLNEADNPLNPQQIQEIREWINQFNDDWKTIHRQCSDETIITALILIQYKKHNYKIPKGLQYTITKYELTTRKFLLIQNRIIFLLMKNTPLQYTIADKYRQYIQTKENSQ